MKSKNPRLLLFLLLAVLLNALLFGTLFYLKNTEPIKIPTTVDGKKFWSQRIDKIGSEKAYLEFKESFGKIDLKTQHIYGHIFSDLLYEKLGVSGYALCDDALNFACYHGFMINALSEAKDLEVTAKKLNDVCFEKFPDKPQFCRHGIGHGILSNLGYDFEDITNALNICDELKGEFYPLGNCKGGVIYEYHFQNPNHSDPKTLAFDENNPYSICPSLPEKSQPTCHYWIVAWWRQSLPYRGERLFEEIGKLCKNISDRESKKACFGAGGYAALAESEWKDADKIKTLCQKMNDTEGEKLCLGYAAQIVSYGTSSEYTSNFSKTICEKQKNEYRDFCFNLLYKDK